MGDFEYSSAGGSGRTSVKLLADLKSISARGGFVDTIENVTMIFSLTHSFGAFLHIGEIYTWWKAVEDILYNFDNYPTGEYELTARWKTLIVNQTL